MFSERLEGLIKAALQDGILTDQEKQAILKRAIAEGEEPAEVEIYIQSLLQKEQQLRKKKEDEKDALYDKEKKAATGRVCPMCGRQVPALTLKCECGHEFQTTPGEKKSSVQELVEKIDKIKAGKSGNIEQQVRDLISLFPVPNTKEDIVEFLALSAPNSKSRGGILGTKMGRFILVAVVAVIILIIAILVTPENGDDLLSMSGLEIGAMYALGVLSWGGILILASNDEMVKWNRNVAVWKAKFDQVLLKGRSLRGDIDFQRQLDYFEQMVKSK